MKALQEKTLETRALEAAAVENVGYEDLDKLRWFLGRITNKQPKTDMDWLIFQMELAWFADNSFTNMPPPEQEARTILRSFRELSRNLIEHKSFDSVRFTRRIWWNKKKGRFCGGDQPIDDYLSNRVTARIHHLALAYGHLVKECYAPESRGEGFCMNLFLANRPNQVYCSDACGSRASSQAAREREKINDAKAQIFEMLCKESRAGRASVDKDTIRKATGISEEIFGKALNEFVQQHVQLIVEANIKTGRLKLGRSGEHHCKSKKNPFR